MAAGCTVQTTLTADDTPMNLKPIRMVIEQAVPHGRSNRRGRGGKRDKGAWGDVPKRVHNLWTASRIVLPTYAQPTRA